MKLISIRMVARSQWPGAGGRHPRGTAEIELLLVIPLLLTILFMIGGTLTLGKARLANAYNAENDAYTQVAAGTNFSPANDPVPPDGIYALRPGLPNRYVLANKFKVVTINGQNMPAPLSVNSRAILLDPAGQYSTWPQDGDRTAIQEWFDAYVAESHPAVVVNALGLQPAGPP